MNENPSPVFRAEDWRLPAPLAPVPTAMLICAAVTRGSHCGLPVVPNTPLCEKHGGKSLLGRKSAMLRREAVRMELFEQLIDGAKAAVRTYMEVMETGEKDADRIRAADRVLELLGFRGDVPAPLPSVDESELPGGAATDEDDKRDFIDEHLTELLQKVTIERVTEVIRVTTGTADSNPAKKDESDERDIVEAEWTPGDTRD